jgi:hypothetical protein
VLGAVLNSKRCIQIERAGRGAGNGHIATVANKPSPQIQSSPLSVTAAVCRCPHSTIRMRGWQFSTDRVAEFEFKAPPPPPPPPPSPPPLPPLPSLPPLPPLLSLLGGRAVLLVGTVVKGTVVKGTVVRGMDVSGLPLLPPLGLPPRLSPPPPLFPPMVTSPSLLRFPRPAGNSLSEGCGARARAVGPDPALSRRPEDAVCDAGNAGDAGDAGDVGDVGDVGVAMDWTGKSTLCGAL